MFLYVNLIRSDKELIAPQAFGRSQMFSSATQQASLTLSSRENSFKSSRASAAAAGVGVATGVATGATATGAAT
jgi:hypothetical protein